MSHDKRKHIRTSLQCKIKITHEAVGEKIVKTRDVSDGGVFVVLEPDQIPPIGSRVTGQVQGLMDDAPILETVLVEGQASQNVMRWEDYTQTAMDPTDDCTIWYVGDYVKPGAASYSTRIGSFRLPGC